MSFEGSFKSLSRVDPEPEPAHDSKATSINLQGTIRKFQHEVRVDYRLFNLPNVCVTEENLSKCGQMPKMCKDGPCKQSSDIKMQNIMKATLEEVMRSD